MTRTELRKKCRTSRIARVATGAAAFLLSLCVLISGALAEEFAQQSKTQESMNTQGVQAIIEGDYDGAVAKFRSSLALGELNVTYLNLGRAYQKRGDCRLAIEAYEAVAKAPRVELPTPDEIQGLANAYLAEIDPTKCEAELQVICSPNDATIVIDEVDVGLCKDGPFKVVPGRHTVVARNGEATSAPVQDTFTGMELRQLEFVVEQPTFENAENNASANTNDSTTQPQPNEVRKKMPSDEASTTTWGYVLSGTGAALLVGAFVLDLAVLGPQLDEINAQPTPSSKAELDAQNSEIDSYNTLRYANIAIVAAGGALVIGGLVLFLVPDESEESAHNGPLPLVWAEGAGMSWSWTW